MNPEFDRIKKNVAAMTRLESMSYLDRIIKGLEMDCEAFGEVPADTAKLRFLYDFKKQIESNLEDGGDPEKKVL